MSDWIKIGQIVSTFGLKGQVKVKPLTDFAQRFDKGSRVRLNEGWVEVEKATWQDGRLILKLSGINKIEDAKALQWAYLEIPSSSLPNLEEDEFLLTDLVGLSVVDQHGKQLGLVQDILTLPAQDVLVVNEIMIPFVKEFISEVDLPGKTIKVNLIEGMDA